MLLPMAVSAHDFEVDGIYYNIINGNEVAVTYKGSFEYSFNDEYSNDVVIPETVSYNGRTYDVTSIGKYAFYLCSSLTNVTIPNSITSIEALAFDRCSGLTSVTIPNSVSVISFGTFYYCIGLSIINIPNSVTTIDSDAFQGCVGLKNITIPNSVTTIGVHAFRGCTGLTDLFIPNSVTTIGEAAFGGCTGLTDITVANDNPKYDSRDNCKAIIETASNALIQGCKVTLIPNSVTTIGDGAFIDCTSLTSVTIPNSIKEIGLYAFYGCSGLTRVDIPNSVTLIDDQAFGHCTGVINLTIGNAVTTINNEAFDYCTGLTSLTIPNSVITIGRGAFARCSGLTSVIIGDSVTTISKGAFYKCSKLTKIMIPNSVDSIGESAFYCSKLKNVTLCGDIEFVGPNVFENITYLYIMSEVSSLPNFGISPDIVYSYATNPPICQEGTFPSYYGTLHVPASSLASYFTADYWNNFANMIGDAIEPKEVSISQDSIEVNLGDQFNLTASVTPSNATPNNFIWITTNANIATVYNGEVTAVGVGECDIIAQCLNKKAICHVIVNDTTITITLDQQEAIVLPNHIINLTPCASPIMPDLSVSSSEPTVAAARVVNNKVQVVGIKEGTTTITIGSVDGTAIPATCLVTVYTEPGDLNCDGFVNISDVTSLIDYLLSGDDSQISTKNADVNGDENINISDVTNLIDILLSENG